MDNEALAVTNGVQDVVTTAKNENSRLTSQKEIEIADAIEDQNANTSDDNAADDWEQFEAEDDKNIEDDWLGTREDASSRFSDSSSNDEEMSPYILEPDSGIEQQLQPDNPSGDVVGTTGSHFEGIEAEQPTDARGAPLEREDSRFDSEPDPTVQPVIPYRGRSNWDDTIGTIYRASLRHSYEPLEKPYNGAANSLGAPSMLNDSDSTPLRRSNAQRHEARRERDKAIEALEKTRKNLKARDEELGEYDQQIRMLKYEVDERGRTIEELDEKLGRANQMGHQNGELARQWRVRCDDQARRFREKQELANAEHERRIGSMKSTDTQTDSSEVVSCGTQTEEKNGAALTTRQSALTILFFTTAALLLTTFQAPRLLQPEIFNLAGITASFYVLLVVRWVSGGLAITPVEAATPRRSAKAVNPTGAVFEEKIRSVREQKEILHTHDNLLLKRQVGFEDVASSDNEASGQVTVVNHDLSDEDSNLEGGLKDVQERATQSEASEQHDSKGYDTEKFEQEAMILSNVVVQQSTRQDVLEAMSKPLNWDDEYEEVIAQDRRDGLEKEREDLKINEEQPREPPSTLRSAVDSHGATAATEEQNAAASSNKPQDEDWSDEITRLKEQLSHSRNANKMLSDECDQLSSQNGKLDNDCKRLKNLLEDWKTFTENKVWVEEPADENAEVASSPTTADQTSIHNADGYLSPRPLPSINDDSMPSSPSPPFRGYLHKKPHWIERERQMQNTGVWKQNRAEILRQLKAEAGEPLKIPPVSNVVSPSSVSLKMRNFAHFLLL